MPASHRDGGDVCTIVYLFLTIFHESQLGAGSRILIGLQKHDKLFDRGVPYDKRIWGYGSRLTMALFPHIGVSMLKNEVEYTRFTFLRVLNTSMNM